MIDELHELDRLRADVSPADDAALARARAALVHAATTPPPVRALRGSWPRVATVATVGVAAAAALLVLPSAGDNGPVASAVTINGDGTVTIDLADIADMPAANKVLADAGIPAELVDPGLAADCEPGSPLAPPLPETDTELLGFPSDTTASFRPDTIPDGTKLVIVASALDFRISAPSGSRELTAPVVGGRLYPENRGICLDDSIVVGSPPLSAN